MPLPVPPRRKPRAFPWGGWIIIALIASWTVPSPPQITIFSLGPLQNLTTSLLSSFRLPVSINSAEVLFLRIFFRTLTDEGCLVGLMRKVQLFRVPVCFLFTLLL